MEAMRLAIVPLSSNTLKEESFPSKHGPVTPIFRPESLERRHKEVKCSAGNRDSSIHGLNGKKLELMKKKISPERKLTSVVPGDCTLSALLLHYARSGLLSEALAIWDQMFNSSFVPDAQLVARLIYMYGSIQDFDTVSKILYQMKLKDDRLLADIFAQSIHCFGKRGHLECMEVMIKQMVSMGYFIDSAIGNAYVVYYSAFGSLSEMDVAYRRLKRSRILLEEEAIRAVSFSYIRENKFYALGRFVHDVGLGRKNVGNLLWNLLLLSYAARFKMKSLQKEFVRMVEAGFKPDLDTFNIRALAFSRMALIWDLHLSLEHMIHDGVAPDLVTYGCVVDAYVDKRLGGNLNFALGRFDWNEPVSVSTDRLVFEAMGKGDFHSNSEVILEHTKRKEDWSYKALIDIYLKKRFRSKQIFWNY